MTEVQYWKNRLSKLKDIHSEELTDDDLIENCAWEDLIWEIKRSARLNLDPVAEMALRNSK
jgi:hypothetical protein